MPEQQTVSKIQSIRTILECIIVAAMLWTGSSLIELKTQTAVVQVQLSSLQINLADLPANRTELTKLRGELEQIKKDSSHDRMQIEELRKLRGLR